MRNARVQGRGNKAVIDKCGRSVLHEWNALSPPPHLPPPLTQTTPLLHAHHAPERGREGEGGGAGGVTRVLFHSITGLFGDIRARLVGFTQVKLSSIPIHVVRTSSRKAGLRKGLTASHTAPDLTSM